MLRGGFGCSGATALGGVDATCGIDRSPLGIQRADHGRCRTFMRLALALIVLGCGARPPSFNERVVTLIGTYPVGGHGGYAWPSRDGQAGTTRDLRVGDAVIAHGGEGNHCVGVTFEVYWRVLESCGASGFDVATAQAFRDRWYVPVKGGGGAAEALTLYQRGTPIALADARPGDFVQAWNSSRTAGHSSIFLGWKRDAAGEPIAMRYWSSQPWTEGIGISEMPLGDAGWDPAQIYIARATCE